MGRKFGRRGKSGAGEPQDPAALFGAPQPPRQSARPASSTPLADQLSQGYPGVDPGYVVLPRSLAEGMSLPWQQQMAALLAQFHAENARLAWPIYRVVPSRYEKLADLDEEQLAEAGYLVEMDADGEMVYRERSGRRIEDPLNTTVLVSCLDPIPKPAARPAPPPAGGRGGGPVRGQAPAAMNIGPAPVWRTVPHPPPPQSVPGTPEQAVAPPAPGGPGGAGAEPPPGFGESRPGSAPSGSAPSGSAWVRQDAVAAPEPPPAWVRRSRPAEPEPPAAARPAVESEPVREPVAEVVDAPEPVASAPEIREEAEVDVESVAAEPEDPAPSEAEPVETTESDDVDLPDEPADPEERAEGPEEPVESRPADRVEAAVTQPVPLDPAPQPVVPPAATPTPVVAPPTVPPAVGPRPAAAAPPVATPPADVSPPAAAAAPVETPQAASSAPVPAPKAPSVPVPPPAAAASPVATPPATPAPAAPSAQPWVPTDVTPPAGGTSRVAGGLEPAPAQPPAQPPVDPPPVFPGPDQAPPPVSGRHAAPARPVFPGRGPAASVPPPSSTGLPVFPGRETVPVPPPQPREPSQRPALPQPSGSALPQPSTPSAPDPDTDTPPRGTPLSGSRGWFDEFEDQQNGPAEGGEFGPTGEPTEIPYRYKR